MAQTNPMPHVQQLASCLRASRKQLGLSQMAAAKRCGVSVRLWAEVERGERPNVSLETALRMLSEVGVTTRLVAADGSITHLRTTDSDRAARAARAEVRRRTWTGRKLHLADDDELTPRHHNVVEQLNAVARVSEIALAIASTSRPLHRAVAEPVGNDCRE